MLRKETLDRAAPDAKKGEMEKIFRSLADKDALVIFEAGEKGITNSSEVIRELGLTQKRYYTRLRELIEAGLMEKREGAYQHTVFGNLVYESVFHLLRKALSDKEGHELMGKLQTSNLSFEAKKTITESLIKTGALSFVSSKELFTTVKMITTYEGLVEEILEMVNTASESIYLASGYSDARVVEAMLGATTRGVKLAAILNGSDQKLMEDVFAFRSILNPKTAITYVKFMRKAGETLRINKISYSFMVVDGEKLIFEIPHPRTKVFEVAFSVVDKKLGEKISGIFRGLFESGERLSVMKML